MTKTEVLASLAAAYDTWQSALEPHVRSQLGAPGAVGTWSIKDILGHVTWVASETVGMLEAQALVGSSTLCQLPEDERNGRVVEMNRDRDLEDLLAESSGVQQKLIQILGAIKESDLMGAEWFDMLLGHWPPWRVLQVNVTDHYLHHAADLAEISD